MSEEARYGFPTIASVTGISAHDLTQRRRLCGVIWNRDGYKVEEILNMCGRALIGEEDAKRLTGIKSRELYQKLREAEHWDD